MNSCRGVPDFHVIWNVENFETEFKWILGEIYRTINVNQFLNIMVQKSICYLSALYEI